MPRPAFHLWFRRSLAPVLVSALLASAACAPPPPPGRVYVVRRPPPARVEAVTVAPGPGYVWVGGHWRWDRQDYAWVPGHWIAPERGHRHWVAGHWARDRRGWYWVDGHWR